MRQNLRSKNKTMSNKEAVSTLLKTLVAVSVIGAATYYGGSYLYDNGLPIDLNDYVPSDIGQYFRIAVAPKIQTQIFLKTRKEDLQQVRKQKLGTLHLEALAQMLKLDQL